MECSIFTIMLQTYSFCNLYKVSESVIMITKLNEGKIGFRKIYGAACRIHTRSSLEHTEFVPDYTYEKRLEVSYKQKDLKDDQ
jgi:hypothetical protein